jgi:hypothetical protein
MMPASEGHTKTPRNFFFVVVIVSACRKIRITLVLGPVLGLDSRKQEYSNGVYYSRLGLVW